MNSKEFSQFMKEQKTVDRWFVLKVAIAGAFFGALLTVAYMIVVLGIWFN